MVLCIGVGAKDAKKPNSVVSAETQLRIPISGLKITLESQSVECVQSLGPPQVSKSG